MTRVPEYDLARRVHWNLFLLLLWIVYQSLGGQSNRSSDGQFKRSQTARENERRTIAIRLKEGGMSVEEIAQIFKCQVDVVKRWIAPSIV